MTGQKNCTHIYYSGRMEWRIENPFPILPLQRSRSICEGRALENGPIRMKRTEIVWFPWGMLPFRCVCHGLIYHARSENYNHFLMRKGNKNKIIRSESIPLPAHNCPTQRNFFSWRKWREKVRAANKLKTSHLQRPISVQGKDIWREHHNYKAVRTYQGPGFSKDA